MLFGLHLVAIEREVHLTNHRRIRGRLENPPALSKSKVLRAERSMHTVVVVFLPLLHFSRFSFEHLLLAISSQGTRY